MKRLQLLLLVIICGQTAMGQDLPYADGSNPFYWKNRKPFAGYWQQDVDYKIKAKLDDQTDIVTGSEELIYTNNSPDTLHVVYFHLYQNAFTKGAYLEQLNKANNFYQKFGRYEIMGNGTRIQMIEVDVNGKSFSQKFLSPAQATKETGVVQNQSSQSSASVPVFKNADMQSDENAAHVEFDNSIMKVRLPQPLLPGEKAVFRINFETYFDDGGTQRRRMKMFKDDWGNKQYDGVHWYPRICVYDRKFGWETDQHLGKEFYGDFGKFDVELSLPSHYVLDATGVLMNRDEVLPADLRAKLDVRNFAAKKLNTPPSVIITPDGSFKTWKFKSINTHDFAWVADPTFRIGDTTVKLASGREVSCVSLSQEPHAAGWQDAAAFTARVISVYSRDIGEYIYPKMIVADARDGMEYPMLTLDGGLSPGYYGLLAHEVGHNWFFGMVGNNETYRASLDEGFTQFLTNWCMTSIFGEVKPTKANPYPISRRDQTIYMGYVRDAIRQEDMPLNTHSDDFNGALNHGGGYGNVYYKTATMLYNLQYVLGDTLFLAAMQHYFSQWMMAHPYFEDFRNSIINFTHADLNWFFDQWLETTKSINYGIVGVSRTKSDKAEMITGKMKDNQASEGATASTGIGQSYSIKLKRYGSMQMPLDIRVYGKDSGQVYDYYIPNTYFKKSVTSATQIMPVWKGWGNLNEVYDLRITLPDGVKLSNVVIDPSNRLADINELNNRLRGKEVWVFDRGRRRPMDRMRYINEWRPDIWYNSIDYAKVGLHFEGNYLNTKDIYNASIWYNTGRLSDKNKNRSAIDYVLDMGTMRFKNTYSYFSIRAIDGLFLYRTGVNIDVSKKQQIEIFMKLMGRPLTEDVDYALIPGTWNAGKQNNTLNIVATRTINYRWGSLEIKDGLKTSFITNDYNYSSLWLRIINKHNLGRLELRSRLYGAVFTGKSIAPESMLYLSMASPEELVENKYTRSRGFFPDSWMTQGADYNHFHAGGGLNVRGYAGYLVPRTLSNGIQVQLDRGNAGISYSLEADIDGFIQLRPRKLSSILHVDAYVFGDVGALSNTFKAGEKSLTIDESVATGIMASTGVGFAFTIKRFFSYDKARPLTIRADFPLLLSNSPYVDGNFFRFRWLVGINRSF